MSDIPAAVRLTVTPAARAAVSRLRAARDGPVMFVQSGGCCAGSTPMCFPDGELVIGDIDARLDDAWGRDQLVLDVAAGPPEGFSLAAGDNLHFITRSAACATPSTTPHQSRPSTTTELS